ncbi:MAG TPA: hypothetical protein VES95_06530, partial [Dermatophilaceae bacterium]|nr:hypothetical protein [Dermatophilaceae bacterium]
MSRATSRPRTTARRRTATLGLTISVLLGGAAACSQASGETVLNLYGGFADLGSPEVVKECNAEAKGRYTIVGNLLPSDADGQREQFVRRLAARDAGMDLL